MTNSSALAASPPRSDSMKESTAATPPPTHSAGTPPDLLPRCARVTSLSPRRARTTSLSSAMSSSTSSSSSTTTTPSGSPSPLYSAVPFSWEHRPGIPKNTKTAGDEEAAVALPLPPPLRCYSSDILSSPRKKRPGGRTAIARDDPFAIALAECAKDLATGGGGDDDASLAQLWEKAVEARRPRGGAAASSAPSSPVVAGRFAIFQLYGSCKTTCTVAEATVRIPRPGSGSLYALVDPARRSGSQRS